MSSKLNPKQERFCLEYIVDLNATQAAIRSGYSEKTAQEIGSENLSKPIIAARVQELIEKRSKRTEITADLVLQELLKIATVDIAKAFNENGDLLPIHEIPEEIRRAFGGIEIFAEREYVEKENDDDGPREKEVIGFTKKIKIIEKTKALELLGRHLKLFTDVIKHEGLESRSDEELKKRLEELEKK